MGSGFLIDSVYLIYTHEILLLTKSYFHEVRFIWYIWFGWYDCPINLVDLIWLILTKSERDMLVRRSKFSSVATTSTRLCRAVWTRYALNAYLCINLVAYMSRLWGNDLSAPNVQICKTISVGITSAIYTQASFTNPTNQYNRARMYGQQFTVPFIQAIGPHAKNAPMYAVDDQCGGHH